MLYTADSTAIISYFAEVFGQPSKISKRALQIIQDSFQEDSPVRLSIPSIVFVEIYAKFYVTEETAAKIRYEVYEVLKASPNIEIKPIEQDVIESFMSLDDSIVNLENHDKLVLASAMSLQSHLITSDAKIISYNLRTNVVPRIIT